MLTSFQFLPFVDYRNSEMDAYGVRCFGSVISASLLAAATLASLLLELTS
ncbi:hypothetical protein Fisuc_0238 [Fibrobacter succinogenes subsp. succinogenes S85]|uniref:Uncharacterized protein n=1 Tax=Fibrobacter succinogenes (strain ATCC 19169 / S85) TaxID=59374 RepID=A0ABM5LEF5_FIBSS|nr:hypothetical protein Fisuc_0238 [Fibrobacter succinogenes subsp. succinogenes S85]